MSAPSDAIAAALKTAIRYTDRNPSDAQKEHGNYQKGKFHWHGETISVENPKGSTRSGTDKGGKRWEVKLPAVYGYLLGTRAVDGDHVDCYVGDDHASKKVWVIDQIDASTKKYDEPKCMLSFNSKEAALNAYEKAFSDGRAKDRIGSVTEMSIPEFRAWANSSAAKKPLGKGYATGGSVMPLDKSLDTARRYAKKAAGGRVDPVLGEPSMGGPTLPPLDAAQQATSDKLLGPHWADDYIKDVTTFGGTDRLDAANQIRGLYSLYNAAGKGRPQELPLHAPGAMSGATIQFLLDALRKQTTAIPPKANGGPVLKPLIDRRPEAEEEQPQPQSFVPGIFNPNTREAIPPEHMLERQNHIDARYLYPRQLQNDFRNGGRPGYEDGGMTPREVTAEMGRLPLPKGEGVRSPVPDWLLDQQRETAGYMRHHNTEGPVQFTEPLLPRLAAEMTGLPSIYRGAQSLGEEGVGNKISGIGEMASGVLPGIAMTRAAAPLFRTLPRTLATFETPQALQDIGSGRTSDFLDKLLPKAHAEEAEKPSVQLGPALVTLPPMPPEPKLYSGEKRKPPEVRVIQQQLKDAGYNVDVDGSDKEGTRRAELDFNQKQYDKALQRIKEIQGINADAQKAFAATQGANAAMAETKRKGEEATKAETAETTRKQDFDRLSETVPVWKDAARLAAPYVALGLGAGGGYYVGNRMARTFAADAAAERDAANALVNKTGVPKKGLNKAVGNANKFSQEGQVSPSIQNPFTEIEKAKGSRGPFWEWNPTAPPSSTLYPEPSKLERWPEHLTAAAKIGAVGLADILPSWHYANVAEEEVKSTYDEFKKHPSPATRDAWEGAKTKEAIAVSLMRLGQGFTPAALGSSSYGIHQRPDMRPNTQNYDALTGNIRERLQEQKDAASAAASQKAKRAKQAKAKEGSPNGAGTHGNGSAPIVPIATGLGAGALPELRSISRDGSSASSLPPEEPPYADGGEVKHHSNFQPRYQRGDRRGKFKVGGPVFPNPEPAKEALTPKSGLSGAISRALDTARKYAKGGIVRSGLIKGPTGGREDAKPISVPSGAYILPADIVSAAGGGNTDAGAAAFKKMLPQAKAGGYAAGGATPTPIRISDGEIVVSPDQVAAIGGGDINAGHQKLDEMVRRMRADHIRTLSALPGPAR